MARGRICKDPRHFQQDPDARAVIHRSLDSGSGRVVVSHSGKNLLRLSFFEGKHISAYLCAARNESLKVHVGNRVSETRQILLDVAGRLTGLKGINNATGKAGNELSHELIGAFGVKLQSGIRKCSWGFPKIREPQRSSPTQQDYQNSYLNNLTLSRIHEGLN